ncbi:50S ribosomal protein L9 [bacterium]|nr:50S ribosomal protein L9 [bacterium]
MKVVLRQDQESLGKRGDVVEVAPGFARNFLLPRRLVLEATPRNMKIFQEEKKMEAAQERREKKEAEDLAEKLAAVSCTIAAEAGQDEKLFGSVTSMDIAEALKKEGIEIDKRKVVLEEPIKSLGIYYVPIKLLPDITAEVKVWVVKA